MYDVCMWSLMLSAPPASPPWAGGAKKGRRLVQIYSVTVCVTICIVIYTYKSMYCIMYILSYAPCTISLLRCNAKDVRETRTMMMIKL